MNGIWGNANPLSWEQQQANQPPNYLARIQKLETEVAQLRRKLNGETNHAAVLRGWCKPGMITGPEHTLLAYDLTRAADYIGHLLARGQS